MMYLMLARQQAGAACFLSLVTDAYLDPSKRGIKTHHDGDRLRRGRSLILHEFPS
jgi:N-acetylmuramoyl-L-alanine amidase